MCVRLPLMLRRPSTIFPILVCFPGLFAIYSTYVLLTLSFLYSLLYFYKISRCSTFSILSVCRLALLLQSAELTAHVSTICAIYLWLCFSFAPSAFNIRIIGRTLISFANPSSSGAIASRTW